MKLHRALLLTLAFLLAILPATAEQGGEITVPEIAPYVCEIPDNEAMAFLRRMGVGWNLGNTFDAVRDGGGGDEMAIEGYWCGVKTTEARPWWM